MTELEKFEKRFANEIFSAGWVDVERKQQPKQVIEGKRDLAKLEEELSQINDAIETIAQKQLRLANLAKFYN